MVRSGTRERRKKWDFLKPLVDILPRDADTGNCGKKSGKLSPSP
jgi:hypothetical protein